MDIPAEEETLIDASLYRDSTTFPPCCSSH